MEKFEQAKRRDEAFYDEMAHTYSVVYGKRREIFEDEKSVVHHLFINKKQDLDKFLQSATQEEVQKVREYGEFHDKLMTIRTKDSPSEEIENVYEDMQKDINLKEYIDKRLPSCLAEDYVSWVLSVNSSPEEIKETLKQTEETEEEFIDRLSMSEKQIQLLFGYVGNRDKEIKDGFEEQFGLVVGPQNEAGAHEIKELDVKGRAWQEYKNFKDIAEYLDGKAEKDTEDEINDRLISDKNFRVFIDKIRKASGK